MGQISITPCPWNAIGIVIVWKDWTLFSICAYNPNFDDIYAYQSRVNLHQLEPKPDASLPHYTMHWDF